MLYCLPEIAWVTWGDSASAPGRQFRGSVPYGSLQAAVPQPVSDTFPWFPYPPTLTPDT